MLAGLGVNAFENRPGIFLVEFHVTGELVDVGGQVLVHGLKFPLGFFGVGFEFRGRADDGRNGQV